MSVGRLEEAASSGVHGGVDPMDEEEQEEAHPASGHGVVDLTSPADAPVCVDPQRVEEQEEAEKARHAEAEREAAAKAAALEAEKARAAAELEARGVDIDSDKARRRIADGSKAARRGFKAYLDAKANSKAAAEAAAKK